jgi:uncharacterized protein YgiM (DUF1202 family)
MAQLQVIATLSLTFVLGTSTIITGLTEPAIARQRYLCTNNKGRTWISSIDRTTHNGGLGISCVLQSSSDSSPAFREATLQAKYSTSRINVHRKPTAQSSVQYIGVVGDKVKIRDQTRSSDGHTWYQVEFDNGAEGWVRGDFVRVASSTTEPSKTGSK